MDVLEVNKSKIAAHIFLPLFCSLKDARADHGVAVQMDSSPGMYIQSQRKAIRLPHLNKLTELVGAIYYHRLSTHNTPRALFGPVGLSATAPGLKHHTSYNDVHGT